MKIFLAGILIVLLSVPAFAHAPIEVTLDYDDFTDTLTVEVVHPVEDPLSHYIHTIEINSGIFKKAYEFNYQETTHNLIRQFKVYAQPDDVIRVRVFCNHGGSMVKALDISGQNKVFNGSGY